MEEKEIPVPTGMPKIKIVTEDGNPEVAHVFLDGKEITGCLASVSFKLEAGHRFPIVTLAMYVDGIDVDVAATVEKVAP